MSLLAESRKVREEDVRRFVEKAIEVYNRYRGAEARAKLLKVKGDTVYVLFEGNFCETCGINDWVDDLRYVMEDLGGEAELVTVVEPPSPEEFFDYRIGVFKVKRIGRIEEPSKEEALESSSR